MPERGIVYNCIRPNSEPYNELFFLIIENPLKLQQIEQKIQELFFPLQENMKETMEKFLVLKSGNIS